MDRLPDFLIIGAAKSGTSTLYRYLLSHPQLYLSTIKEPCFFDANVAWSKGLDWYRSLFADARPDQRCGEASTNYTRWPQVSGVPARIAATLPEVKLIYLMRHPVDRAHSHYVHRYTKEVYPGQPITKTFEEFVDTDPMCLDSSDYMLQITQYLEYFPREAFLFLLTETLSSDPAGLLQETLRFLGVDSGIDLLVEGAIVENKGSAFRDAKLRSHITEPLRKNPLLRRLAYAVSQSWRDQAYALFRKTSYGQRAREVYSARPMRTETRKALLERYRPSNQALSELTGLDLRHWDR
jgi:hypothetical protein